MRNANIQKVCIQFIKSSSNSQFRIVDIFFAHDVNETNSFGNVEQNPLNELKHQHSATFSEWICLTKLKHYT